MKENKMQESNSLTFNHELSVCDGELVRARVGEACCRWDAAPFAGRQTSPSGRTAVQLETFWKSAKILKRDEQYLKTARIFN